MDLALEQSIISLSLFYLVAFVVVCFVVTWCVRQIIEVTKAKSADVPGMLPAPKDEPPLEATDATIVEMWADGQMTLETIAQQLKVSYYRVQRVTSEAKKRGVVRK